MRYLREYTDENGKKRTSFCDEENADFYVVPKDEYISVSEWNGLVEEYNALQKEKNTSDGDTVTIPTAEYNGLQKALRIVRDRAKQQIDKSTADENGYTLLRADKRQYEHKYDSPAWLITMSTPYSIKMSLGEVNAILDRDLRDFYGFRDLPEIISESSIDHGKPKKWDIKDFFSTMKYNDPTIDRSMIQNNELLQKLAFLDSCDWKLAFEISRIAKNHATGCYEVSVWATAPM